MVNFTWPKGCFTAAARVHADDLVLCHALFVEPLADFEIREHGRAGPLGDANRVGHVVEVAVRHEQVVGLHVGRLDRRGGRFVEKRIEQNRLAATSIDQQLWPNQVI